MEFPPNAVVGGRWRPKPRESRAALPGKGLGLLQNRCYLVHEGGSEERRSAGEGEAEEGPGIGGGVGAVKEEAVGRVECEREEGAEVERCRLPWEGAEGHENQDRSRGGWRT